MRIEFEAAAPIDDPTPEEVDRGLRSLCLPDNSFAILEASPGCYIQAAGDEDSFDLEYQQGSTDDHYRVPREVRLEEAIEAFKSYLRQDGAWRSKFAWERMDRTLDGDAWPVGAGILWTALLALMGALLAVTGLGIVVTTGWRALKSAGGRAGDPARPGTGDGSGPPQAAS